MERANFPTRLGAFLVDLAIFAAIIHLFFAIDVLLNLTTRLNNFGIISLLGGALLLIGYGTLEVFLATTPGKRACGLIIASEDGQPATRRALIKRWAVKHSPVFACAPTLILWTLISPYNYHAKLPDFVAHAVHIFAVVDTYLTSLLLIMVMAGCFFGLTASRQTLHDSIARTALFPRQALIASSAFSPVLRASEETTPTELRT